ncbi:hypothetical protein K1T71_012540 [Dendrolimus kikuchii]|uniref:Uncharacterized protein n=1 Tax=Dendrolimus kikuchii TaxID=765133 RepID=A0ACC1CJV1_9NEOP|nr:hypothetical protein K1T71_012540 [Dendrolimus kikuchii]
MFGQKLLVFSAMLIGAQCRYVYPEVEYSPEDVVYVPAHYARVRRQAHGSLTVNSDGTSGAAIKVPIAGNDKNILSAIGSADLTKSQHLASSSFGLALDNVNGHGATLTKTSIPGFGDQVSAAGKVNLFHNDNHDLNAKAFATRNMPNLPQVPNFDTVGAGVNYMFNNGHGATLTKTSIPGFGDQVSAAGKVNLFHNDNHDLNAKAFATRNMPNLPQVPNFDTVGAGVNYMFKDKIGASASAAHTDFINRNDYSLGSTLNLFKDRDTSLDFNAGVKKFETPFVKSGWEPNFGFSFSKYF